MGCFKNCSMSYPNCKVQKWYAKKCQSRSVCIVLAITFSIFVLNTYAIAFAQSGQWSKAIRLSQAGVPAGDGVVVGDSAGNIYVAWPEASAGDKTKPVYDTVFISRRRTDGQWSSPVDVLFVSGSSIVLSAFRVNALNELFLLWGDGSSLYLSTVNSSNFSVASKWTTVTVAKGSIQSGDMQIDSQGMFHIVFVENNTSILYTSSSDAVSWKYPKQIGLAPEPNTAVSVPKMAISNRQLMLVSWTVNNRANNWMPAGIWVAKSDNQGQDWSPQFQISNRDGDGQSTVFIDSQNVVRVAWNRAAYTRDGRYYTFSLDNGVTWEKPQRLFAPMAGLAGSPSFCEDSAGNLFMILSGGGYGTDGINQVWISRWSRDRWMDPESITGGILDAQGGNATMVQGNVLAVIWHEASLLEVWFRSFNTGAPQSKPAAIASPIKPTYSPVPQTKHTPTTMARKSPTAPSLVQADVPTSMSDNAPVGVGVIASLAMIAMVVILSVYRRHS